MWSCKKCNEAFDSSTKLRSHRKIHSQKENSYVNYLPLGESDAHYKYRLDDRNIFICITCDTEMLTKEEMEKHVLEHEDKYICDSCSEHFISAYEFSCHQYKHNEQNGFCCPLCTFVTKRRAIMLTHINNFHLNMYKYYCDKCGKGFNDRAQADEHDNVHQGVKPFQCVVCLKAFVHSTYLYNHQVDNHQVLIKGVTGMNHCHICNKGFERKRSLRRHMLTHNDNIFKEKKHLCDICGKGFYQSQKLKIHYRVHTGEKPYVCSYCPKSFTKKDYLIMHERIHSGEKPYACEYCGKCFNQVAPLRIHVRNHTGERPYACHLCQRGFISRNVLNAHLKCCPGVI